MRLILFIPDLSKGVVVGIIVGSLAMVSIFACLPRFIREDHEYVGIWVADITIKHLNERMNRTPELGS
jgi:hypothetical protein